jgi:AraC-like DNA-binding protein
MSARLDDLIILHGGSYPRCRAVIDKRFIGYSSLQCIDRGAVDMWVNQRHWRLEPGWLWTCLPGPRIRFQAAPGNDHWSHRYVAVRGPLLDAWRREGLWPEEPCPWPSGVDVAAGLDAVLGHLRADGAWDRRQATNRLEGLLLDLAAARCEPAAAPWLAKARRLLAEAPIPIDVPGVAGDCGLPTSTFRRRFSAAAGMSPRDFALSSRLERARVRLLADAAPVAAIAADLGFRDPSFFARQFRQATGLTPLAYRHSRQ